MRYSTEPKFRNYVKWYGFLSLTRKTASKRVVQKTAEVKVDLIMNKIADKITSVGKPKKKEKAKKV